MQLVSLTTALLTTALAVGSASAQPPAPTILNYDTLYDHPDTPLSATACSADAGVLKGYKTFGEIPNYPHIAGSFFVEGFNSSSCGACYSLLYNRADGTQVVLSFTVVNSASGGFISSAQGVKDLTGLDINEFPGNALISILNVPSIDCGF
ncbi:hypothetical protein NP233_g1264 [Leucocoprinus birnbaumii]|uniref:Cerato-platanin n=1 Tax=Leucocoprinus birnbaumii TaxID=56174 RepID=A0AAD5W3B5_9AGAR|nr:hypothetical protein NP233_g1264 [Leucocoprinus birnbaumii]